MGSKESDTEKSVVSTSSASTNSKEPDVHVAPEPEKDVLPVPSIQLSAGDARTQKFLESSNMVLPAGAVMEVTAGDEKTQKTLDSMDSKTKEALSRSLNDCLANRSTCSAITDNTGFPSEVTLQKALSPTEETQAKIDSFNEAMKEAVRRSLTDFFRNHTSEKPSVEPTKKEDVEVMDIETKEAVRRSLDDFFARRKTETKIENTSSIAPTEPKEEEIPETMDVETKEAVRRSLDDFFARRKTDAETKEAIRNSISELLMRRMNQNKTETETESNEVEEEVHEIETPSVTVDIAVSGDDDLSEGIEEVNDDDLSEATEENVELTNEDLIVSGHDELDAGAESIKSNTSEKSDEKKDDWQMVTEDEEMIATAAQMLGSALFHSDASLSRRSDPSF